MKPTRRSMHQRPPLGSRANLSYIPSPSPSSVWNDDTNSNDPSANARRPATPLPNDSQEAEQLEDFVDTPLTAVETEGIMRPPPVRSAGDMISPTKIFRRIRLNTSDTPLMSNLHDVPASYGVMPDAAIQPDTFDSERVQRLGPRERLDTAETPVFRNLQDLPDDCADEDAADVPPPPGETSCDDDCFSNVSSLSNDDSLFAKAAFAALNISGPLPDEVAIPECPTPEEDAVPDWLKDLPHSRQPDPPGQRIRLIRDGSSLPPPPASEPRVRTTDPSPLIPRPTFGRFRSCPTVDFSLASSSKASTMQSIVTYESMPLDAIVVNGKKVTGVSHRDGMADPFGTTHKSPLLGERPRRLAHRRIKSTASASVGSSMVSSFMTAPTAAATITSSSTSFTPQSSKKAQRRLNAYTGADDGPACCQSQAEKTHRRPGGLVKEEVKYMLGVMSSPMRKLPLVKTLKKNDRANVKLNRSKGFLA